MRDIISQLIEDKKALIQQNETVKNESATLVKFCENLKSRLQKAEQIISMLKEQVSDIFDFFLQQLYQSLGHLILIIAFHFYFF